MFARRCRDLLLLLLVAVLCFGGSFTCRSSTHDDDGDGVTGTVNLG